VWVSAFCGFLMAVVLAAVIFRMPAPMIAAAGVNGFVFGFFRIAWIVIASIYLYNVAVETGQFQVMKESIAGVSSDRRLQVILIAFCFGAFLEGSGGGGAPVAIAGSFLIGLGFPHFQAATLCLLANTAPVAWGGVGNPVRVLNGVTGLPIPQLNAMVGRILPPFSFILPAWLAISFMVGLAYITKYAGMDTVMGLSLTRTGWTYPFFGTLLGWLGVALTGTDAGSNALFGKLQKVTAEQLGISPVLMASANSAGGVMGKMIDAQSIVVASTACRLEGREAEVWKAVFWHSLVLASLVGLVVMFYAYVAPWLIPG